MAAAGPQESGESEEEDYEDDFEEYDESFEEDSDSSPDLAATARAPRVVEMTSGREGETHVDGLQATLKQLQLETAAQELCAESQDALNGTLIAVSAALSPTAQLQATRGAASRRWGA